MKVEPPCGKKRHAYQLHALLACSLLLPVVVNVQAGFSDRSVAEVVTEHPVIHAPASEILRKNPNLTPNGAESVDERARRFLSLAEKGGAQAQF